MKEKEKRKRRKNFKICVDTGRYICYITKAVARQQSGAKSPAGHNTGQSIERLKKTFKK
ncbi:MAG: hypothetical protein ACI4G0_04775 [Ruminococcus sp.]